MDNDVIQADYEVMNKIGQMMLQIKESIEKEMASLQRQAEEIGRSWDGASFDAFQAEWSNVFQPSLMRLVGALDFSNSMVKELIRSFQEAEGEAADRFNPDA